jgi:transcription elongation factor GreA
MSSPRSAVALIRSLDLLPDGPIVWDQAVPSRSPGIFLVEVPVRSDEAPIDIVAVRDWLERVPGLMLDGERPTASQLAARLASFWLPQETVVYVGRTSKSLAARVSSLLHTPLGDRKPHPGGHWLWTLRDLGKLRIWWAETAAAEEYEDGLANAIAADVEPSIAAILAGFGPILPWANMTSAAGDAKRTGITGAQLADGEAPAVAPKPTNAAPKPAARRASPARATTTRAGKGRNVLVSPNRVAPTMVTAGGLKVLQAELLELTTVRRPEVILRVKSARELGDLRENADYEAARNEQSFLEGRIRDLEQMIKTAVVIQTVDATSISLGSRVVVDAEGSRVTLDIVGSAEADPAKGRISDVSPVGKALLGHRAGDEVVIRTPGNDIHYLVIEVAAS